MGTFPEAFLHLLYKNTVFVRSSFYSKEAEMRKHKIKHLILWIVMLSSAEAVMMMFGDGLLSRK